MDLRKEGYQMNKKICCSWRIVAVVFLGVVVSIGSWISLSHTTGRVSAPLFSDIMPELGILDSVSVEAHPGYKFGDEFYGHAYAVASPEQKSALINLLSSIDTAQF